MVNIKTTIGNLYKTVRKTVDKDYQTKLDVEECDIKYTSVKLDLDKIDYAFEAFLSRKNIVDEFKESYFSNRMPMAHESEYLRQLEAVTNDSRGTIKDKLSYNVLDRCRREKGLQLKTLT